MVDELRSESSPLAARLAARGGGPRATVAFLAGAAGLGAFVASLLLDWVRLDVSFSGNLLGGPDGDHRSVAFTVTEATFGAVYELGVLALLTMLGAAVLRPDLAARLRLAATALGIGVGGVVLAIVFEVRTIFDRVTMSDIDISLATAYHSGTYCAIGAVVALVAGVWLAAAPNHPTRASVAPVAAPAESGRFVGGQPTVVAFVAGIAGAATFVASMFVEWQRTDMGVGLLTGPTDGDTSLRLSDARSSIVYLLGGLALLGLLGLLVARPELGARLRLAAVGLGLGLGGVLAGIIAEMRDPLGQVYGPTIALAIPAEMRDQLDGLIYEIHPGPYLAVAAVVTLVGGVWLSSAPAAAGSPVTFDAAVPAGYALVPVPPVQPAPEAPVSPTVDVTAGEPPTSEPPAGAAAPERVSRPVSGPAENWLTPVGHVDGITVTASETIDIGGQTDILRS